MRARILQKEGDVYVLVWMFRCMPVVQNVFNDIRIDIELDSGDIDTYAISIADGFNDFCTFVTQSQTYSFPLPLKDVDSLDGAIHITIPSTLQAGQYSQQFELVDTNAGVQSIFGVVLFDTVIFSWALQDAIDASGLPVIFTVIKPGFNVPIGGGVASLAEKLEVINVLADWLLDVNSDYVGVVEQIDALDETSTADEIYDAYTNAAAFRRGIPYVTLSNALESVENEVLHQEGL